MKKIGIEDIHFYTSDYYLDMSEFAESNNQPFNKYISGIGQEKMSVNPPDEDVVTLGANSAYPLLEKLSPAEKNSISHMLFATETGIDQSKAAGIYVHALLGLQPNCRVMEFKQACYSGTFALQSAINIVSNNLDEKVLVVASDISKYELNSSGSATEGCGAVAMLISANPKILTIEQGYGVFTMNIMDFWRPNYRSEALVDGKYSAKIYLQALLHSWDHFHAKTKKLFTDISYMCYHLPFSKMANKAEKLINKHNGIELSEEKITSLVSPSQFYNRIIGNSYTASLYIAFVSLLEQTKEDLSNQRIGFFSYGSGCVSEFFTGIVMNGYKETLATSNHLRRLKNRIRINYQEYLVFHNYKLPEDGSYSQTPKHSKGRYRLSGIENHCRTYENIE